MNSSNAGDGAEPSQFAQVFFEEAGENLERMEQQLLAIDIEAADDETLNTIFRCAHSVKGGAATFGFGDVAELTHQMETLLDKLRRHELEPNAAMVDILLLSGDALKAQLALHQSGGQGEPVDSQGLLASLRAFVAGETHAPTTAATAQASAPTHAAHAAAETSGHRALELLVGPLEAPAEADPLVDLFAEIAGLGTIEPLDGAQTTDGMRRFKILTTTSDDDLLNLFTFHLSREKLKLRPLGPALEASTLRVSVEKVDQLIKLIGELATTQAMLAQTSAGIDPALHPQLAAGLSDLERHTRDLQASVMSISKVPMSMVFGRFPRMLRELAAKLGKQVDFVMHGGSTELDKGLVEKIIDPLTHMVRNSCDHGIELPEERRSAGKSGTGTITLAAFHQRGSVVIEVRDDGRGLSRPQLLKKARERGIDAPDGMADADVWALIFAPGFSTVDVVTDVSGRGVGMDVVKKNITAVGGTVEIDSCEGFGMRVRVRLPLQATATV